jgi:hypothetical protein
MLGHEPVHFRAIVELSHDGHVGIAEHRSEHVQASIGLSLCKRRAHPSECRGCLREHAQLLEREHGLDRLGHDCGLKPTDPLEQAALLPLWTVAWFVRTIKKDIGTQRLHEAAICVRASAWDAHVEPP